MDAMFERVLSLQPSWTAVGENDEMDERGDLVRNAIPESLSALAPTLAAALQSPLDDLTVVGKDGAGFRSRVPWVRVARRSFSPSPREGWYAVYLFAEDGSAAFLSINQGTQIWDGAGLRPQPIDLIEKRTKWARDALSNVSEFQGLKRDITLGPSARSTSYEVGNVGAMEYLAGRVPHPETMQSDLVRVLEILAALYGHDQDSPDVSSPAPEAIEAQNAVEQIASSLRDRRKAGFAPNAKQRRAIELRATEVATEYWHADGWKVTDVSATQPFDLEVSKAGLTLSVEVKGTTGLGEKVVLTRGEVKHQKSAYPSNALVVVTGITLDGPNDAPTAAGGEANVLHPWLIAPEQLEPLAFIYRV